ncbi:hypothetical protein [Cryobacterium sp. Hz9]|uniref:hypothetical protein n=1 Tax=Cryobacterium sp. Hz9 TaxID=1259167 RepID=UPI001068DB97|nr:hypothetical protein [Cryobacterium sp. Hz9]TFB66183.1 hypothetical protein E3N85_10095 [Cryobacterium sp. Hz9]
MKIDAQLRSSFERQKRRADKLRPLVDGEIKNTKDSRWHYESRVKKEQSFALKTEAGKAANPDEMEDFFACVIVVPNFSDIPTAEQYLRDRYDFSYKRPEFSDYTSKEPFDFRFDDLRVFVRYRDDPSSPPTGVHGALFEVQVRTFLQHAWSVATHDVVYKSETLSWRRERVANQVKATLEQAEVTIENMRELENSDVLPKSNSRYDAINGIATVLRAHWSADDLPADVRRLSEVIHRLVQHIWTGRESEHLEHLLVLGREGYGGRHNFDWSPYRATLQYLAEYESDSLITFLKNPRSGESIFVYDEVLRLIGLSASDAPRAIILSDT